MKQTETVFKHKKKYIGVMILCFLYAGFAILTSFFLLYNAVTLPEVPPETFFQNRFQEQNQLTGNVAINPARGFKGGAFSPFRFISSPILLVILSSGIIALFAGMTIWSLTREKEIKSIKEQTTNTLLLPDERKVIETLRGADFELTQAKLSRESGLSKVQVHRTVKRLEDKGLLEKHKYGLTNKILLKKEFQ